MFRPEVDRHKCVGSGNCLFWAPATFDLDEEGLAVVIDPTGDDPDRIRVAVDGCPSKALTLRLTAAEPGADPDDATSADDEGEEYHGHRSVR